MTRSLCAISIHHTCPSQTVNLVVGSVYATWTGTRRTRVHGERYVYQGPASLTRQSWQCIDCTHVTTMLAHNGISRASPSIGSRLTAFWTHFRSRRHRAVGASTRAAGGHFLIMLLTLMHDVERWSTGDSRVKLVSRVHRASECLPATNHRRLAVQTFGSGFVDARQTCDTVTFLCAEEARRDARQSTIEGTACYYAHLGVPSATQGLILLQRAHWSGTLWQHWYRVAMATTYATPRPQQIPHPLHHLACWTPVYLVMICMNVNKAVHWRPACLQIRSAIDSPTTGAQKQARCACVPQADWNS